MFTQESDTLLVPSSCVLSVGISSRNRWLSILHCFYWNFPGWAIPVLNSECWFTHRRHGDLVSSISYISQYKYVIYKGKIDVWIIIFQEFCFPAAYFRVRVEMENFFFKITSTSFFKHVSVFNTRYIYMYHTIYATICQVYLSKENTVCIR